MSPSSRCWLCTTLDLECGGWPFDQAHIGLSEHWLSKAPNGPRLSKEEANDPRLLRPVCRANHHSLDLGNLSLKREHIPPSVWEFAKEKDLLWRINQTHPI